MNTHLLISLKHIEMLINELEEVADFRGKLFLSTTEIYEHITFYKKVLFLGKPISLDDKTIMDKSKVSAVDYNKFESSHELDKYTVGYQQALKDLL